MIRMENEEARSLVALPYQYDIKRNPRMGASDFDYLRNPQVPLLVPEAAARRAGSSSRLAGPTRHPMGSQD